MADAIKFETNGIPAVPILTDDFQKLAKTVLSKSNAQSVRLAFVRHPFWNLTRDEVAQRAREVIESITHGLTQ